MSTRPLRIALVSREYPPFFGGGIGTYARWIVPALVQAGVRVHVVTQSYDKTHSRIETDGLTTVHRVPLPPGGSNWTNATARFSVNAAKVLARLWRTDQIDVAEFAECEAAGFASLLVANQDRPLPTIVQLHTPSEQLLVLRSLASRTLDHKLTTYFHAERLAMRLAHGILAPSQFIADWAHGHYALDRCPSVIPYATGPLPPAPPPPPTDQPMRVLYAGRIEPRKGVESMIRAWSAVARQHPDAKLYLAGADTSGAPDGGSMRAYLQELIDDTNSPGVEFLGKLSPETLKEHCAQANICIIPSLWENFPNTCIESMSSARAVLVGGSGGMREMIGNTRAGLTFVAGDESDLASKLISMLNEGAHSLAERGLLARTRIEYMCDPVRIAQLRIEHYKQIIDHTPTQSRSKTHALMNIWKGFEHTSHGGSPKINLPTLDPMVKDWVENEIDNSALCKAAHEETSTC